MVQPIMMPSTSSILLCGDGLVQIFDPVIDRPPDEPIPLSINYKGKVWIFGGGNGLTSLNDVWTLDIRGGAGLGGAKPMRWRRQEKGLALGDIIQLT